jgi:hypothetical protein
LCFEIIHQLQAVNMLKRQVRKYVVVPGFGGHAK